MTTRWHFREFKPGDNASDPDFARALFSRDAEAILTKSLVRESVQNSLDARIDKSGVVTVRFVIRTGRAAASASAVARFFEGAWEHLHGDETGVEEPPKPKSPLPYLVVEDFGTKGLVGDAAHWDPFGSAKNSFFLFFRALGRSGKEGEDRGRWGVGKFVFPLASLGHCLFGYTVPLDTRMPLLMGRMILKTHRAGDQSYHPDGHWGLQSPSSALVLPEQEASVLADFRKVFSLKRTTEPGLSVIVPWLTAELNANTVREAVVSEYFLPILRSELEVEIDDNGLIERIDSSKVQELAATSEPPALRALLRLGLQAATWPDGQLTVLPEAVGQRESEWRDDRVPKDAEQQLIDRLAAGEPVGVRVPLKIQRKGSTARETTHFDLFVQRVDGIGRQRPLIVREGITIPEDKTGFLQDHVALVVVDHPALAGLVGDAETPAHNELQQDLIKNKFRRGRRVITLMRTAAAGLIRSLERSAREDDTSLLANFFPIPDLTDDGKRPVPTRRTTKPVVPPLPPARPRFHVTQIAEGFRVRGTDDGEIPDTLTVRFAYEVRRGNPFKKYDPADFSLLKGDLQLETRGVLTIEQRDNGIVVHPTDKQFVIEISGFDKRRDLRVRVDATSSGDAQ